MDISNETMIHVKKGKIEYLQFRKLLEYEDKVRHCFTLKGENNDYTRQENDNYKLLVEDLGLKFEGLTVIKYQEHGNNVGRVNEKQEYHVNEDALITNKREISLALRFADCTPILLYSPKKNAIGNIHSGWKGTLKKIGQIGAEKMMKEYDIEKEELLAFIGPCIGMCHFEVGEDVKEKFEHTFSYLGNLEKAIKKGEKKEEGQKYFIDTTWINIKMLEEIGIPSNNIINSNICTVCNKEYIHSYRGEKERSGRNTMIIGLK